MEPDDLSYLLGKRVVITRKTPRGPVVYGGKLSKLPKKKEGDILLTNGGSSEEPETRERIYIPFKEIKNYKSFVDAHPYVSPYYTPKR
ncbi:MAG: hypothetical protein ACRD38_08020 [Nitrososphaerales archaeon]